MSTVKTAPPTTKTHAAAKSKQDAAIKYPFWFGGSAASMAAVVTHPLDLVKVRLQTRTPTDPKTMLGTFVSIFHKQGPLGLYNGLSAALLRQMTYSTVRFGVYEDLKQRFPPRSSLKNPNPKKQPMHMLVLMSSLSGMLGGIVGNPADVLNVRMQSDFAKPPDKRFNYNNAFNGLVRIVRDEGPTALFRGVVANSVRALMMTSSQLASYDTFKHLLLDNTITPLHDNLTTHFIASLAAGFVATTICSPVDVVKTRIMTTGGSTGIVGVLGDAFKKEGVWWMFRGWTPSFIRLGPQTVVTMLFFEQHKKVYRTFMAADTPGARL